MTADGFSSAAAAPGRQTLGAGQSMDIAATKSSNAAQRALSNGRVRPIFISLFYFSLFYSFFLSFFFIYCDFFYLFFFILSFVFVFFFLLGFSKFSSRCKQDGAKLLFFVSLTLIGIMATHMISISIQ